jgi:protein gp37
MTKSKIEWCDFTINPVKGLCPMACSYCYARRMYKRFKWDETIRFEPLDYKKFPNGSKVFVGSTMELFGDWVKPTWLEQIFEWCRRLPNVTFIFLTKQPQNLIKWSPFPDNCWVGVSTTNSIMTEHAGYYLSEIRAKVKFVSFEPLQSHINSSFSHWLKDDSFDGINWVIIGQQTPVRKSAQPKIEWVREIVEAADKVGILVYG